MMQVVATQQPAQPPSAPRPSPEPGYVFTTQQVSGAEAMLVAARAAREELDEQLDRLEEKRQELTGELRRSGSDGAIRSGLERRIAELDMRISDLDKQMAAADAAVAKAAAIPGAVVERPDPPDPPEPHPWLDEAMVMTIVFTIFVLFPLAVAQARRLWRRSAAAVSELPQVIADRLGRMDQAIDAIAIEVERISEGQRFLTKVMASGERALGAGPAEPVTIDTREPVSVRREGR